MERSNVDKAFDIFSGMLRNYPFWPSTFSTCECGRALARGNGKCAICLEEELEKYAGKEAAMRAHNAMIELADSWRNVREEIKKNGI